MNKMNEGFQIIIKIIIGTLFEESLFLFISSEILDINSKIKKTDIEKERTLVLNFPAVSHNGCLFR